MPRQTAPTIDDAAGHRSSRPYGHAALLAFPRHHRCRDRSNSSGCPGGARGAAMSDDEQPRALLLRYAEIFLKGRNRAQFERRLIENIRKSLRDCPGARVEVLHGRLLAWPGQE